MTTDPPALDPAQLYAIIGAAIDADVPAEAAVETVEAIITEADHETESRSQE